jgi:hypothetical protein
MPCVPDVRAPYDVCALFIRQVTRNASAQLEQSKFCLFLCQPKLAASELLVGVLVIHTSLLFTESRLQCLAAALARPVLLVARPTDTLPRTCSTGLLACTSVLPVHLPSTVRAGQPASTAAPHGVGNVPYHRITTMFCVPLPLPSFGGHRQWTRGDIDPRHSNRMAVSQIHWSSRQPPRPPVLSIECCIRRIRISFGLADRFIGG